MAKYRDKIENERVAGNPIGEAVLKRLLQDGVLVLKDPLYFIQNDQVKFLEPLGRNCARGARRKSYCNTSDPFPSRNDARLPPTTDGALRQIANANRQNA